MADVTGGNSSDDMHPVQTMHKSARKGRSKAAASTSSRSQVCVACDKDDGRPTCNFRKCRIHTDGCDLGSRSMLRVFHATAEGKVHEKDMFKNDKPQWRLKMAPFIDAAIDDGSHRLDAINDLKGYLATSTGTFKEKGLITDLVPVTRKQFKKRCRSETSSEMSSDDLNERFELEQKKQHVKLYNDAGKPIVEVSNSVRRSYAGDHGIKLNAKSTTN
jgi:hypothetical protein